MRVLVACEYSGVVRDAFAARGHEAWSCDLLPSDSPGNHYQGDVRDVLYETWNLLIAHPPCTALTAAGQWYYKKHPDVVEAAAAFFMLFVEARHIPKRAIENPAGIMTRRYRKPNQVIDPYFFGEPHRKRTCLWLFGLPRLNGLEYVARDREKHAPDPIYVDKTGRKRYFTDAIKGSGDGGHKRSKSFQSIADAMARQWG